ncbi:LOW QUALITY PROTEIN: putative fatty acyl-CoA reductase CG5065 [Nilaparvata lugens]|uniref:LOW QUALITY PROTEIN: putative fatty acyl-CoA reductase CG5065 n=1 Tax=Nilaparvata lugens TaxID=108931 RepID=UPI00193CD6BA|nr:LOW QUALITY PROTEIN: putative fatty acyl-CoA reductase CG5065 [Nilaparvata lugens]
MSQMPVNMDVSSGGGYGEISAISEFYRGREILITGGTGFIGKVLVEKLLRSCPHLSKIYLIIRSKKGKDVRQRLNELLNASIFDNIKKQQPEQLGKVIAVPGDITLPDLGLSNGDQAMLTENVSIVFHSAATVKFDEALKPSVAMNLLGTKRIVQLCQKLSKLEALIHVSTAYCNCNMEVVMEQIYPPPARPEEIIHCIENMDEKILDTITPQIIGDRPNTYTYTKALAETVLLEMNGELPIAIVRPSIVTAAWREPLAGWVDNLNGPTGLFVGAGKGVLRTLLCHKDYITDLIPVDIVINVMIAVAWKTATSRQRKLMVYNCTTGVSNPIYWRDVERLIKESILMRPCENVIWYPGGSFKGSRFFNSICVALSHLLPAYLMDACTRIAGRKPIMVTVQNKLLRAAECLEFFTTHEWKFTNTNVLKLYESLPPSDRESFNFNVNDVNWQEYMQLYWLGIRRFILKEDTSNDSAARSRLRKVYWIHRISQLVLFLLVWRLLMFRSQTMSSAWFSLFKFVTQISRLLLSQLSIR